MEAMGGSPSGGTHTRGLKIQNTGPALYLWVLRFCQVTFIQPTLFSIPKAATGWSLNLIRN